MQIVDQPQALHVIGLELRTRNEVAFQTIPPHWQRFTAERVLARIADRLSDDVYAVYTHFAHAGRHNVGTYSLVIGAAVPADAQVPEGLVRVVAPASRRAIFPVPAGRLDLVGSAWQGIWGRSDLHMTCIADYEHYRVSGEIDILVGIRDAAGSA